METRTGRDPQRDFVNDTFGTLRATERAESHRGIAYFLTCTRCGAQGQRVTQEELARGITPTCKNSGCGSTAIPERRTADAYPTSTLSGGSVRDRMNAARRQQEVSALEGNE